MMVSNKDISNGDTEKQVKDRLLETAEGLFAEKGFDGTSIREITSQAKCNLAAVNYHFGGKEKLYSEVFRRRLIAMRDVRIASIEDVMSQTDHEPTLEELIRAFAIAFIEPLVDKSQGQRFIRMTIREMLDPRLPKRMFAEEVAIPTLSALGKAMSRVCPGLGQKETVMSIISVVGQLMNAIHLNEMFVAKEDLGLPMLNLTEIVDHIVEFSTAGIQSMVEEEGR